MSEQSIPRYRILAKQLKNDILSGRLKPGDQLHTELELCEIHDISRHTAREALRLLSEDGLIARRRGAGTIVAEINAPAFAQPIGDFESILKYARDAHFELDTNRPATSKEIADIGLKGSYYRYDGLRRQVASPPLALTVIFALAKLAPDAATVKALDTSISEWIERTHSVAVNKVTQRMEAVALKNTEAKKLKVEKGSPALATTRTYHDASGRVILYSHSLHPAGRFVYEFQLDRTRS